jgi:hypothetical protein
MLNYDAATGVLTWKVSTGGHVRAGAEAGTITNHGYRRIMLDGTKYLAHRLAWYIAYGAMPAGQIDHINGNRADNRLKNLRDVSQSVNQQNQRRAQIGSGSGLLGVHYYKARGKWQAHITVGGRSRSLGYFAIAEDAQAAYLAAKRQLHAGCTL